MIDMMLPPPQYDHPPALPVIEYVLTGDVVDKKCREALEIWQRQTGSDRGFSGDRAGSHLLGCAFPGTKGCLVIRIDDASVRRHEYGHCNGWPGNHLR